MPSINFRDSTRAQSASVDPYAVSEISMQGFDVQPHTLEIEGFINQQAAQILSDEAREEFKFKLNLRTVFLLLLIFVSAIFTRDFYLTSGLIGLVVYYVVQILLKWFRYQEVKNNLAAHLRIIQPIKFRLVCVDDIVSIYLDNYEVHANLLVMRQNIYLPSGFFCNFFSLGINGETPILWSDCRLSTSPSEFVSEVNRRLANVPAPKNLMKVPAFNLPLITDSQVAISGQIRLLDLPIMQVRKTQSILRNYRYQFSFALMMLSFFVVLSATTESYVLLTAILVVMSIRLARIFSVQSIRQLVRRNPVLTKLEGFVCTDGWQIRTEASVVRHKFAAFESCKLRYDRVELYRSDALEADVIFHRHNFESNVTFEHCKALIAAQLPLRIAS